MFPKFATHCIRWASARSESYFDLRQSTSSYVIPDSPAVLRVHSSAGSASSGIEERYDRPSHSSMSEIEDQTTENKRFVDLAIIRKVLIVLHNLRRTNASQEA